LQSHHNISEGLHIQVVGEMDSSTPQKITPASLSVPPQELPPIGFVHGNPVGSSGTGHQSCRFLPQVPSASVNNAVLGEL